MVTENPYTTSINPYAPTTSTAALVPEGAIYRNGKTLIMHRSATLPDICIKSNEPTSGFRLKRKFSWHNPWFALLILFNILLYALIAILISKRATVMIPLSEQWRRIRRRRILNTWLMCLGGPLVAVIGFIVLDDGGVNRNQTNEAIGGAMALLGILVFLFGILYGMFRTRLLTVAKIDDNYIHLRGAHPDFLDRFETASL